MSVAFAVTAFIAFVLLTGFALLGVIVTAFFAGYEHGKEGGDR